MTQELMNSLERDAVYKAIFGRRDVRKYFKQDEIPVDVLARVLKAAHHAGSVGFMQPWDFILINDREIKKQIHQSFLNERTEAAELFDKEKKEKYLSYKLEGILEAPINICVTCDSHRMGPQVLGRHSIPETDIYSTVCAIQNLWLAARAENLGVGWVSILKRDDLYRILNIPRELTVVGYLCIGYVTQFSDQPDLEALGWAKRENLDQHVYFNIWNGKPDEKWASFFDLLNCHPPA